MMLVSSLAFAKESKKEEKPVIQGKFCLQLDKKVGFSRCETTEVICYLSKGGEVCWSKPVASNASPAPAPSPSPAVKK